jgi:Tol biopolymer transport system component
MLVVHAGTATGVAQRPGRTTQLDLAPTGAQPLRPLPDFSGNVWHFSSISADGRFVAFDSWSKDLVPGDTNLVGDVFVRDRERGATVRVSVTSNGGQALPGATGFHVLDGSRRPYMSADGRFVAFESSAPNLAPGDTNLASDVFVHDMSTGKTELVSVATGGKVGNAGSLWASLSSDGRYVAFASGASNLDPHDTNGAPDVFVHDRKTHTTTLASLGPGGAQFADAPAGSAENLAPSISPDGHLIAFTQTSLEPSRPYTTDVFVRNLVTRKTVLANVSMDGSPQPASGVASTPWNSRGPVFSRDNRYLVFTSNSGIGLVPNPRLAVGAQAVYVRDFKTGRTSAAMVSWTGESGGGSGGTGLSISGDGRFVVFESQATNLDQNYGNHWTQEVGSCLPTIGCDPNRTFVHDMVTGATTMVSRADDGSDPQPPFRQCGYDTLDAKPFLWMPAISANGRYVSFEGCGLDPREAVNATAAPAGAARETQHVYVREVGLPLGVGGLVARGQLVVAGSRGFSRDGIARFADPRKDVGGSLAALGADLVGGLAAYRPEYGDLFFRLEVDAMPCISLSAPGLGYGVDLTVGNVRYQVRATRRGPTTSFTLYRMSDRGWSVVTDLRGGWGTTGPEVVVALPLSAINAGSGGTIDGLSAFTALDVGADAESAPRVLDRSLLA